jgi:hypothetical protein
MAVPDQRLFPCCFLQVPFPDQQEVKHTRVSQRRVVIVIYPGGRDFESLSENEYFLRVVRHLSSRMYTRLAIREAQGMRLT